MRSIILKTFGGLQHKYYFRQLIFSLIFTIPSLYMVSIEKDVPIGMAILFIVNTLLYPYSRFVYEAVMDFLRGDTVFLFNAIFYMLFTLFTMSLCWAFAILMAPVGLAYLYYLNNKALSENTISA